MARKRPGAKRVTGSGSPIRATHLLMQQAASPINPRDWDEAQQHLQTGELHRAQQVVDRMLAGAPDEPNVLNLKAIIAARLNQFDAAEAAWRHLLRRNPRQTNARSNLGALLVTMGHLDEAIAELRQTLVDDPSMTTAHTNLGVALDRVGQQEEALRSYERAVALEPRNAQTLFNIGKLLQDQHDSAGAHARYLQVLALDPSHGNAFGNLLLTQHYSPVFDPAVNRDTARHHASRQPAAMAWRRALAQEGPLRVGFVSADLRNHSVAHFLVGPLTHIDRSRVRLYAYSNSAVDDWMTGQLRTLLDGWQQIDTLSDREAADLVRRDEIDVLIDLSGWTAGHRQGLFALRPAPLQVAWLGYFSTTGHAAVDYVLADPVSVPSAEENLFIEKVWRLPAIRYCFTPPPHVPAVGALPAMTAGYVTFASFQTLPKINARVLQCWSRILSAAPKARLRIQNAQLDISRMRSYFEDQLRLHGLPRERVVLVGPQARDDYFSAYDKVDVVLDTFPYPGGTTTAEALWMGVPTLTLALPGMLGRQGEAIMGTLDMPSWITHTESEYVARAASWGNADAHRLGELSELRRAMRERAARSPLFDAKRFAHDLEDALWGMWTAASMPSADHRANPNTLSFNSK